MNLEQFKIEYSLGQLSTNILWSYISSASGLSNWFADSVLVSGKTYTFIWNKQPNTATLLNQRQGIFIRFRMEESDNASEKSYFELRLSHNELTNDSMLQVIDHAYSDEIDDSIELWNKQVATLKRVLGL